MKFVHGVSFEQRKTQKKNLDGEVGEGTQRIQTENCQNVQDLIKYKRILVDKKL
jgi:hypothetical protein